MRGELRKVLCTRWSAALLAALVALNGVLFYRYCTQPQGDEDYTLPQLRAAYARSDAELQADYDAQWARLDAAEPLTDEVYDEIYLAMSLDEAVLTQRETVRSYPDYVRSLREEAEAKQRSGFFGAPDGGALCASGGARARAVVFRRDHGADRLARDGRNLRGGRRDGGSAASDG